MAKIIPAILVNDFETFKNHLRQIENAASLAQIDVTDGKFVPYINFADYDLIKKIKTRVGYEMHLMVKSPKQAVAKWLKLPQVKRVAIHIEAAGNSAKKIFEFIRKKGRFAGIAVSPPTPIKKIIPLLPFADFVLILGVTPGKSGQRFQKKVLKKITILRRLAPEMEIEVDGGVNFENAKEIFNAGATTLAAASSIWKGDPRDNLKRFEAI